LIVFLALGTVGCDPIAPTLKSSPVSPKMSTESASGGVSSAGATPSASSSCEIFTLTAGLPQRSALEYVKLREYLLAVSSVVQKDPNVLVQAHTQAVMQVCSKALQVLKTCGRNFPERKRLLMNCREFGASVKTMDRLDASLETVFSLNQNEKGMNNALLDVFYSDYVAAIDPFATLSFGVAASARELSGATVMNRPSGFELPSDMKSVPVVSYYGKSQRVLRITFSDWREGSELGSVMSALEQVHRDKTIGAVLFDLRHAGGYEASVLQRLRESAAHAGGWAELPTFLWVDSATHGFASVFAVQWSQRSQVEVWGSSAQTYGFGRKLVNASVALSEGLLPAWMSVGGALVNPEGESNSEGFVLRVDESHRISNSNRWVDILDRADSQAQQTERKSFENEQADPSASVSPIADSSAVIVVPADQPDSGQEQRSE
jgi:hypothetical protein